MDERIRFLKQCEIFSPLSREELVIVLDSGRMETYTQGSIIFKIGEPADAVYVVKTGVVEICRPSGDTNKISVVAYLGDSDPIGETAIITGSPRASMARVPEKAEILKIDKVNFMDLLGHLQELSMNLLSVFAKRLEHGFRKERAAARHRHLSGKLKHFDLPTIIQTLANSSMTGTLTVTEKSGKSFAMLYFETGQLLHARLGHLKGKEAFFQLFQSPRQDAFTFRGGPPPIELGENAEIAMAPMGLLLESARQQDELKDLKARYPNPRHVFQPKSKGLAWDDNATMGLAKEIWGRLQRGQTIAQMVAAIPTCEYVIYKMISEMHAKGLVA